MNYGYGWVRLKGFVEAFIAAERYVMYETDLEPVERQLHNSRLTAYQDVLDEISTIESGFPSFLV